jgi:hypothetical protein
MNNLAVMLDSQGKYEEAEKMHRQTQELVEKSARRWITQGLHDIALQVC